MKKTKQFSALSVIVLFSLFTSPNAVFAQNPAKTKTISFNSGKTEKELNAKLEKIIPQIMNEAEIPGLSMALIRDGKLFYQRGFGITNSETKTPVTEDTVFEAASLSKPVFAYAVMKLIEAGKLDLDTPLVKYMPGSYIEKDERVNLITARMVLTHRTGFPNWAQAGQPLTINFTPGERFSYSGEGFVYLQKVVEHLTGKPFDAFMRETVFDPLGMTSSSYIWQEKYETRKTYSHNAEGKVAGRNKPSTANSAASLHTTARDYAIFVAALLNNQGLKKTTFAEMFRPQVNVNPDEKNQSQIISWGLGLGLQSAKNEKVFWHWGDNGNTKAYVAASPKSKSGIVIFMNSANGLSVAQEIINQTGGEFQTALAWLKVQPFDAPEKKLLKEIINRGQAAIDEYERLRKTSAGTAFGENQINWIGYQLLSRKMNKEAIAAFKMNVESFPASANVYDSLGEAFMKSGEKELAIRNYKKSLELNPKNTNAAEILKRLEKPEVKIDPAIIDAYLGEYQSPLGLITITKQEDKLFAELAGQSKEQFTAESEDIFLALNANIVLKFIKDDKGQITSILIRAGGEQFTAKKVK